MLAQKLTGLQSLSVGSQKDDMQENIINDRAITNSSALAIIHALTALTSLAVAAWGVDDMAAKHVTKLRRLRALDVRDTQVSGEMVHRLVAASQAWLLSVEWNNLNSGYEQLEL